MNEQAIRFRFGIFVLASLILLAVLTILFGGFPSYFKRTDDYTVIFASAPSVAPGTPVRRSGVRIGEVRSVRLDNITGKVEVAIRIEHEYSLRKGDRPTLLQGLIGGDASISFLAPEDERQADATPVPPGTVLQGVSPADAGALVQKASDLFQPAKETLDEIRKTFQGINNMKPVVEDTLKNFNEIGKMANQIGPDLQETAKEFRQLSKMARETIPELKGTNAEIGRAAKKWGDVGERADVLLKTNEDKIVKSIERAEEGLKRLNEVLSDENQKYLRDILKNAKGSTQQLEDLLKESRGTVKKADDAINDLQKALKPWGERGPQVFKNVEDSSDSLNKTLKDLRELMQVVARSDGTVQRLLSDPSLYNNLNDSAVMATRILPRLDRVMRDMEIFADKLARHPELIGLRGAIVPSIGLKESPSVIPYRVLP